MTLTVMSLPAGTSMVAGSIAKSLSDTSIVTGPSAAASPSPAPGEPPSPVHDAATSATTTAAVAAIPLRNLCIIDPLPAQACGGVCGPDRARVGAGGPRLAGTSVPAGHPG